MSNVREELDDLIHAWAGDDRLEIFWEVINRLIEEEKESALAAARKALEDLLGQFTQPCHPGEPAMSAMVPVRELDRYRAALERINGEGQTPTHQRVWTGPGELERTGYIDPEPPKED